MLKTIKATDHVSIVFGEWFNKTYGNTYYDALVRINDETHEIRYQYGYNAGDHQSVTEALESAGYRLRTCKADRFKPFNAVHTSVTTKLKRELFK